MKILDYVADDCANITGMCLQGTIETTYDELVEKFGKPTYTDADPYEKVACEWVVEAKCVEDGMDDDDFDYKTFTVYSWKTGCIPTQKYEWHIGGHNFESWSIADDIINKQ